LVAKQRQHGIREVLLKFAAEMLDPADSKSFSEKVSPTSIESSKPANPHQAPLSLTSNFRWALTGNVVNALCQYAMIVVLTQWGTDVAIGQFDLGLAIASNVLALAMLQLRNVQITDMHRTFGFADYFGTRIVWTFLGLGAIAAWGSLASDDTTTLWIIILVGLMKSVDSISDIVRGLFQFRERMDLNGASLIVRGISSLLAFAVAMILTGSVVIAVAAAAVSYLIAFVAYDLVFAMRLLSPQSSRETSAIQLRPRFRLPTIAALTWIALPLGAVMAMISLQTNIPRYVLESYFGTRSLGYFGPLVYPMMAGMMVTTAMGQSASPRLAKYFADDVRAFTRLLGKLAGISAALGVALMVGTHFLGDRVLQLLYGPPYAAYHREFEILALAWGIQLITSCWGYGLTAARCFRLQVVLTVISCLATLAASYILIPRYGVMGAALSVLVTSLAAAIAYSLAMLWVVRASRTGTAARENREIT
jgi:O-antigen/teichoic acid export membrane protein